MRRAMCISLLLAAAASARAEDGTIGFEDASLDAMPPAYAALADLVRGTIGVVDDKLHVTIELASLPEMTPGVVYAMLFSNGTADWYAGVVTAPSVAYAFGTWNSDDDSPDSMHDAQGSYVTGSPGTVTVEFPFSSLESGFVSEPRGLAADIKGGAPTILLPVSLPFVVVDRAEGSGELILPSDDEEANETVEESSEAPASEGPRASASAPAATRTSPSPASSSAQVPGFGASIALAALLGALVGARRSSR